MPYANPADQKRYVKDRWLKIKADPAKLAAHRAACKASYDRKVQEAGGKEDVRKRAAAWREKNPGKVKAMLRRHNLKRYYGLTPEGYQELLDRQGGGCAICTGDNGDHHLAVDHCHKTGQVRGLLCDNCNQALGKLKDSPTLLRAAIAYLEEKS